MGNAKILLFVICCLASLVWPGRAPAAEPVPLSPSGSAIDERHKEEMLAENNRFSLLPYKQNYILPLTYNSNPNNQTYTVADNESIDRLELKFQLSFKIPLAKGLIVGHGNLFAGYTQQSYWQAYNWQGSSPFRETNYEPELYADFASDFSLFGLRSRFISVGLLHQSNGTSGDLSRSWNRIYTLVSFERGHFYCAVKPWYHVPEGSDDDNPDIEKYLGYGEFYALYILNEHRIGLMLRNNLRLENRGAIQIDWSFPLSGNRLQGYLQYFNGYGESLIDYNHENNRIGLGIIVSNWL